MDVGMEGRGAWRSRITSCTPGVQYQRGNVLCICDDDGSWPNPVCRDLFRILHTVEVTEKVEEATSQYCKPTKLYLVGCNTCLCPSSGKFNATYCTNRTCSDGDPVLEPKDNEEMKKVNKEDADEEDIVREELEDVHTERIDVEELEEDQGEFRYDEEEFIDEVKPNERIQTDSIIRTGKELEVYASCNIQKTYTIGRQQCKCLSNNRLICKEHDNKRNAKVGMDQKSKKPVCSGKIGKVIKYGCNLCKCMKKGYMYCTLKKCKSKNKSLIRVLKKPKLENLVEAPIDDLDCVPGTTYKRGCNNCFCKIERDQKVFGCTVKACYPEEEMMNMVRDCVPNTSYEIDCLVCSCDIIDGQKHQVCNISPKCSRSKENQTKSLDSLNGSCEPLHVYTSDCNTCTCMSDGKIVRCTTRPCVARSGEPIEVEIVPLQQAVREICPKGHSYKIDCNLCFCLPNGNALCTTSDCSKQLDY